MLLAFSIKGFSVIDQDHNLIQIDSVKQKKADSIFNLGRQLFSKKRQFKNAKEQFDIADSLYLSLRNYKKLMLAKRNKSVCIYAMFKPFEDQERPLKEALKYKDKVDSNAYELAKIYNELHLLNSRFDNHETAKYYAKKALDIFEHVKLPSKKIRYDIYLLNNGIAFSERNLFNYKISEKYSKKALLIAKNNEINPVLALSTLFYMYVGSEQNEKVADFLNDSEKMIHFTDAPLYVSYDFYLDLMDYYSNINNEKLAIQTILELDDIISKSKYKKHFTEWFVQQSMALTYLKAKKYKKVIDILSNVNYSQKEIDRNWKYKALDESILGECYFFLGKQTQGFKHVSKSLQYYMITNSKKKNFHSQLDFNDFLVVNNTLINKLLLKFKICKTIYLKTKDTKYLNLAINTLNLIHQSLKELGARSKEDDFINEKDFKAFYADLLDFYRFQWLENPSKENFYKALQLCDESKIVTILSEIKTINYAKLFKYLPKEILSKEKQIFKTLDSISEKMVIKNDALISVKDSIDKIFSDYKIRIAEKYPKYYQLKFGSKKTVESIVEEKFKSFNLIEYFVSNDYIYVFNINDDKRVFDKIKLTEKLQKNIDDYIKNVRSNKSNSYKNESKFLYETLFKKYIDSSKKTALILDGDLHLFPIESLWIPSENGGNFLIEFTSVLRLNSISQEVVVPKSNSSKALLFAPYASNGNEDNVKISSSLNEVNAIGNFFDGQILLDEKATKQEFLNSAKNYAIIHLATHSYIDKNKPLRSKIIFNNSNNLDPNAYGLKIEELYNIELNSELVTLSACETGLGKDVKGKGVLSLSNAFAFAGVSSTVMSLWKVPDEETAKIMISFYENIKKGLPKDKALQAAKINYLKNTNDDTLKHPYYWAGFVINGSDKAIESRSNFNMNYVLITLIIIIIGTILYRKKRPSM
jgi:CHAT domain-containing protein